MGRSFQAPGTGRVAAEVRDRPLAARLPDALSHRDDVAVDDAEFDHADEEQQEDREDHGELDEALAALVTRSR